MTGAIDPYVYTSRGLCPWIPSPWGSIVVPLVLLVALLLTYVWASDWLLVPILAIFAVILAGARWGYDETTLRIDDTDITLRGPTDLDMPLASIERVQIPRFRWLQRPITLHSKKGLRTHLPRTAFDTHQAVADALRMRGVQVV